LIPSSNLSREPSRSFETPIVSPANHPSVGRSLMEYDVALHGGNALGRCHGCGISVTEEWRRGPDGPRSLCDSCGVSGFKRVRGTLLMMTSGALCQTVEETHGRWRACWEHATGLAAR
jgi:hypothetical protein